VLRNSLHHVNTVLLVMHYFTAKFTVYRCVCRLKLHWLECRAVMFQGRNTNQRVHVSLNASWRHWDFYFRGVCLSSWELSVSCFLYWSLGFIWSSFNSRLAEWTLWNNFMYLTPSYFPSGRYCGNFFIFFSPKICCLAEAIVCFYFCIFPSQLGGRGSVPQFSKKLLPKP